MLSKSVKYVNADGVESAAFVVKDHGTSVNLVVFDGDSGEQELITSVLPWKQDERERSCYKD